MHATLGLALGVALAACSGERVAECDAMLAVAQRASACGRIDAAQRMQVDQSVRTIKDALDRLEGVGPGQAPADLADEMKRTCAKQEAEIRRLYEKVAPECLQ